MKRLYGNLKMSWLTVILFAIVAGVYTGIVLLIPALKDTSFQDIGIGYEWWVIFAVIIVVNCEKNWEAMLKCFVFFLISQPLAYLVQVPFSDLTLQMSFYYYKNFWLMMTILTLPGGFIAYYCKKQNAAGATILGLGNSLQAILAVSYLGNAVRNFPQHVLSCLVCIASIFVMSYQIQEEKKYRLLSLLIPVALVILCLIFGKMTGRVFF